MTLKPIPDPKPLRLPGRSMPLKGWIVDGKVIAFGTSPSPDNTWVAVIVEQASGKILHGWELETQREAIGIAAQEYVKATGGPERADIYQAIRSDWSRN